MTTPIDIEAAAREAVEQAGRATPGPWAPYLCHFQYEAPESACGINGESWDASHDECHHPALKVDVELLCHARTREPLLAAEVLRLRAWMRWLGQGHYDETGHYSVNTSSALRGEPAPEQKA